MSVTSAFLRIADQVALLADGKIVESGPAARVTDSHRGTVSLDGSTLTFKIPVTSTQTGSLTRPAPPAANPNYVVQLVLIGSDGARLTELLADATVSKRVS